MMMGNFICKALQPVTRVTEGCGAARSGGNWVHSRGWVLKFTAVLNVMCWQDRLRTCFVSV